MNLSNLKLTLLVTLLINLGNNYVIAETLPQLNESEYIIAPTEVNEEKVPKIITNFPLNGFFLDHTTKFKLNSGYQTGKNSSENLYFNSIFKLDGSVTQSLTKDNIFISDSRGIYLKLKTFNERREVTVTLTQPQTMTGMAMQQTFSGSCGILNNNISDPDSQCSYLPALVTDRNSIDPKTFLPTRIQQLGKIGQEISPENMAVLQQPGFQNTGLKGESFGLDLYWPNIGRFPGNDQSNTTKIERFEDIDTTYSLGLYRTRQIVKTNGEKAVLGRTIYGSGFIINDENFGLNTAVSAIAQILPEVVPELEGTTTEANTNINKNLFIAANNTRLPDNSFVFYYGGIGKIKHRQLNGLESKKNGNLTGSFDSIWIGLSPVTKRTSTTESYILSTGQERAIVKVGGEGGINSNASFVTSNNNQTIASSQLDRFYIQGYLSLFERDINYISEQTLIEKTNYYPHVSITGNQTNNNQVFRYYTGVIFSDKPKFYLGGDYTKILGSWRFDLTAINYLNPDQDYFSKVESSLNKSFRLGKNSSLTISSGFRYAWEREQENRLENPTDNFVGIGGTLRVNNISLGVTQLLDLLPDSIGNKFQANLSFPLGENISLKAYLSPQKDIQNYGISLFYALNKKQNTSLSFNWNRSIYDYGEDYFSNKLETTNDNFTLFFQTGF
jgi:hypothetical protein